jgi:hypothetical protein
MEHVNYPHGDGQLYDCPACEAECFCDPDGTMCVYCAIELEGMRDEVTRRCESEACDEFDGIHCYGDGCALVSDREEVLACGE